jgi:RNA-directed DNA polymerase
MCLAKPFLENLARTASYQYFAFTIPKRTGGSRRIYHPSQPLKAVQRWLLQHQIEGLPLHSCAFAYRKRVDISQHARVHVHSSYLLRIDFADFFPSIDQGDIGRYIAQNPSHFSGWSLADIGFFSAIVCRDEALAIGAPSSPALSNALCFKLDSLLSQVARESGVAYSRYADDLFFSTAERGVLKKLESKVRGIISTIDLPASLRVRASKTRHSSKKRRRVVTGLVLTTQGGISLGRRKKRELRSAIHRFVDLSFEERASLAGYLAYAKSVEPDFVGRLIMKYGAERIALVCEIPADIGVVAPSDAYQSPLLTRADIAPA